MISRQAPSYEPGVGYDILPPTGQGPVDPPVPPVNKDPGGAAIPMRPASLSAAAPPPVPVNEAEKASAMVALQAGALQPTIGAADFAEEVEKLIEEAGGGKPVDPGSAGRDTKTGKPKVPPPADPGGALGPIAQALGEDLEKLASALTTDLIKSANAQTAILVALGDAISKDITALGDQIKKDLDNFGKPPPAVNTFLWILAAGVGVYALSNLD